MGTRSSVGKENTGAACVCHEAAETQREIKAASDADKSLARQRAWLLGGRPPGSFLVGLFFLFF